MGRAKGVQNSSSEQQGQGYLLDRSYLKKGTYRMIIGKKAHDNGAGLREKTS